MSLRCLLQIELITGWRKSKINIFPRKPGHFQAYQVFVNKVSFASFINSIKRRINWPKLCTRASLLPNLLPCSLPSDCARARARLALPTLFTSNLFSPPLLLLTLTVYFPFTLFAPLIFHSAWRLSWNLVNTGKLKASSKGPFILERCSPFSRKKFFTSVPIQRLLTLWLWVPPLRHGYYTFANLSLLLLFVLSFFFTFLSLLKRTIIFILFIFYSFLLADDIFECFRFPMQHCIFK